jgi:hypothetical protein
MRMWVQLALLSLVVACDGKAPEPDEDSEQTVEPDSFELDDSEPIDTEVEDIDDTLVDDTEVEDTEVEDTEVEDTEVEDTEPVDTEVEDTEPVDTDVEDTLIDDTEAEETGDTFEPVDSEPPAAGLSYAADVAPIFASRCAGCHLGGGVSGGLDLRGGRSALVGVASSRTMVHVNPGSTATSYLWHKLAGTQASVSGAGSRMPLGSTLSSTDLATVETWILDGALP